MTEPTDKTVLIIDDEDGIRAVISALLGSVGVKCITAQNREEAVAAVTRDSGTISTCLLDMNLEESTGEELYDELLQLKPELQVYAMSGMFDNDIRERMGHRKLSGFIPKPFAAADLISVVTQGLATSNAN